MPLGVVLLTLILLTLTTSALVARQPSRMMFCLPGLCFVAYTMWERHRSRDLLRALRGQGSARLRIHGRSVRPDNVLVAILYPDHLRHLRTLLASVEPTSSDVIILALEPSPDKAEAADAALLAASATLSRKPDLQLSGEAARGVKRGGYVVALMTTAGADPALLALEAAQSLCSARMLVVLAEEPLPDEQRRRAHGVWESLAPPRRALRVEMVAPEGDDRMVFDLGLEARAHVDIPERAD